MLEDWNTREQPQIHSPYPHHPQSCSGCNWTTKTGLNLIRHLKVIDILSIVLGGPEGFRLDFQLHSESTADWDCKAMDFMVGRDFPEAHIFIKKETEAREGKLITLSQKKERKHWSHFHYSEMLVLKSLSSSFTPSPKIYLGGLTQAVVGLAKSESLGLKWVYFPFPFLQFSASKFSFNFYFVFFYL